jgi:hypothetical protein
LRQRRFEEANIRPRARNLPADGKGFSVVPDRLFQTSAATMLSFNRQPGRWVVDASKRRA